MGMGMNGGDDALITPLSIVYYYATLHADPALVEVILYFPRPEIPETKEHLYSSTSICLNIRNSVLIELKHKLPWTHIIACAIAIDIEFTNFWYKTSITLRKKEKNSGSGCLSLAKPSIAIDHNTAS